MSKILTSGFVLCSALFSLSNSSEAQTARPKPLQLCLEATSGNIVSREKCSKKELRLSSNSLRNLLQTPAVDPTTCYWRVGTPIELAGAARQLTVKTSCDTNDFVVSHVFEHNEQNPIVAISSTAFDTIVGAAHTLPQSVEYRINISTSIPAGENIRGEVDLLCCKIPSA